MQALVENVLILSAELFYISGNTSQLVKLIKTKNRHGLSAINQTLNASGNVAWAAYFFSNQLYVPCVTNLTMFTITTMTLSFTLMNKTQFTRGLVTIGVLAPMTSFLIVTHPATSGWIGVSYNFIATMPWIIHIVRRKKTSGISERGLYFGLAAIACTFIYALMTSSGPLVVGTLLGFGFTGLVMRYYYKYRHHKK